MTAPTIKLRPRAEDDLTKIHLYTRREWGVSKANAYIREIHQAFLTLANHRTAGRDRSEVRPGLRSFSIGSHVIFYQSLSSGVLVVRILHQMMDYERHLRV